MSTVASTTRTQVVYASCSACHQEVPASVLTPHYRGRSNSPLCPSCAAGPQVMCTECLKPSPRALLVLGVCGCTPVADVLQFDPSNPFGLVPDFTPEEEAEYREHLEDRDLALLWE